MMNIMTELLQIAQERSLQVFTFDFGRYLIGAGTITALVWLLKRTPWKSRQIQKRSPRAEDFRREFLSSIRTVMVYAFVSIFIAYGVQHGVFYRIDASFGLAGNLALLAAIIVAHDAYFYWSHRAMHHRTLFKTFHRFHHRTITPTPWAAYAFALPEAFVMVFFMPIWLFFVPTPGIVIVSFLLIMIFRNAMAHAGLELHARGWASHPVLKWISTTTHHDMHHAGSFKHNYGFYFTYWDKLMGTEHPDYVATYDRVTASPAEVHTENGLGSPAAG